MNIVRSLKKYQSADKNENEESSEENVEEENEFSKQFESNIMEHESVSFIQSEESGKSISKLNIDFVLYVSDLLGVSRRKFIVSSDLEIDTKSTQRLIDIIKKIGGDVYIEGGGAAIYQDDSLFALNNIKLVKQSFISPAYEQKGLFENITGVSILDALFNVGHEQVREILENTKLEI